MSFRWRSVLRLKFVQNTFFPPVSLVFWMTSCVTIERRRKGEGGTDCDFLYFASLMCFLRGTYSRERARSTTPDLRDDTRYIYVSIYPYLYINTHTDFLSPSHVHVIHTRTHNTCAKTRYAKKHRFFFRCGVASAAFLFLSRQSSLSKSPRTIFRWRTLGKYIFFFPRCEHT